MNTILSFNEYNGQEIQQMEAALYEQMLNEKSSLNSGIRGFLNRTASGRVKSELSEEIEMSKTIMDGIQKGLETLNDNFDVIKKNIADQDNKDSKKGQKQKALDEIIDLIENSKKNTWDIHELIDEGEIDYAGFTANVGIASVAYFGILLTPFRATVMIHKGYNYFFNIVKNTIRKALVMLQLNFDQFENLIITKGFQSADFIQTMDTNEKITEFYMQLETEFVGKGGVIKGKQADRLKHKLQLARDRAKQMREGEKIAQQNENAFNCLDQYNNTYTRSLETLRQYSQDDVQKHLDAIKTSMSKLAGQDVDLQTYSELIIAAAEEHAYKVSSSIYNKFAKMTEVFSLPNQQKLIDLIVEANKEERTAAKKARNEKKEEAKKLQEKLDADKTESDGIEVFKSLNGTEIGEIDEESRRYDDDGIEGADKWTYEEFKKLDDDQQEAFETWLQAHPEVLNKCDDTLQVTIYTPYNEAYHAYVDSLVDYIEPCITDSIDEAYIFNFDEYIFESKKKKKKHKKPTVVKVEPESGFKLSKAIRDEIDSKLEEVEDNFGELLNLILGSDFEEKTEYTDEDKAKLEYVMQKYSDEDGDGGILKSLEKLQKNIDKGPKKKYYIDFDNIDKSQIDNLKELYENEDVANAALEVIGERLLNDKTFVKNRKNLVKTINKCFKSKKEKISLMTSILLVESIKKLKDERSHDYPSENGGSDKEEKSEK